MRDDEIDTTSEENRDFSDNKEDTEEDDKLEEKMRIAEAFSRMVFDDNSKTLDMRKRRVTDLPQNSKVFLPPPLNPMVESGLSVRKQEFSDSFADFMKNECDDRGKQLTNSLTTDQTKGLRDIKKKSKD